MEDLNIKLLSALKSLMPFIDADIDRGIRNDNRHGGLEYRARNAKAVILEAEHTIAAAEQAQQAEPVAWKPGNRPPSVFKTSEAGRQFVADYFAKALRRHDFSSYIKGHLAADFACALSDGLHAMQQAQPPAVAGDVAKDAARYQLLRHGRHWSVIDGIGDELRGEALDAAIDAAAQKGGA